MPSPTLSVVMPAYNNEPYIREAIRSILDQDYDDFELVVADHSSTDGTWEALQEFRSDPRLRLLRTEAGGGAERNFNRVSAQAKGRYLKLVCGDDLLRPGVLRRQVDLLNAHPTATVTACPRSIVDSRGNTVIARRGLSGLRRGLTPGPVAIRRTVRAGANIFGEPGSVTIRREVLKQDGYWFFTYPYLVDEATYVRALMHGDFVADLEVGAAFRLNSGQTSVALTRNQAEQVRGFHSWLWSQRPDLLSSADVRTGNRNAGLMAHKRRLAYALLQKRMG